MVPRYNQIRLRQLIQKLASPLKLPPACSLSKFAGYDDHIRLRVVNRRDKFFHRQLMITAKVDIRYVNNRADKVPPMVSALASLPDACGNGEAAS